MIALDKRVVEARLDQLGCSGEEQLLWTRSPTQLSSGGLSVQEGPKFPKWIGWYYLVGYAFIIVVVAAISYF